MSRELHLTSGSITPQLIRLYLPLLGANVLQQLYNIINALVVTRYIGDNAFAALGVAESVALPSSSPSFTGKRTCPDCGSSCTSPPF